MKRLPALLLPILVVATSGCMNDRTKRMVATCQSMLVGEDVSGARTFIRDAEAQLASLDGSSSRLEAWLRDLQDPDAMKSRPALEQCLVQLKSRQA